MTLLVKMLKKRLFLTLATVCTSVLLVVIMLWWNAQLSSIIDIVSEGNALSNDKIVLAVIIMFVMCVSNSLKSYVSGLTCEFLTHDLRMGYARYFSKLSISEIERLNAGEQLSKLQMFQDI